MTTIRKRLLVLPASSLAVAAVALVVTSLNGSSRLPVQARSLTDPPRAVPMAGAEAGPTVVVTRDWQEVAASPVRR